MKLLAPVFVAVLLATGLIAPSGTAFHPASSGGGGGGGGNGNSTQYTVTFLEQGLPDGTSWGIVLAGQTHRTNLASVVFTNVSTGTYTYTVVAPADYSVPGGTITVSSDLRVRVSFAAPAAPAGQPVLGSWPPGNLELTLIAAILGIGGAAIVVAELVARHRRRRAPPKTPDGPGSR